MKQLFLKSLIEGNTEVLKFYSKIIAIGVRNEIEQFHVDYLTDGQMKELNPLIRNAIYKALFTLSNSDTNAFCRELMTFYSKCVPDYWEDPELDEHLQKVLDESTAQKKIQFKSSFLNQQFALGNLFYNQHTRCIEIRESFNFKEVDGDKHKHRDKISAQLRKEGYGYHPGLNGYVTLKF